MCLTLSLSANFVITSLEKRLVTAAQGDNPEVCDDSPTGATFKITDCKLYIPIVTLSAENDNKLLEQLKVAQVFFTHFASKNQLPGFSIIGTLAGNGLNEGFKRSVYWNEYK